MLAGGVRNRDDRIGLVLVANAEEYTAHGDTGGRGDELLRDDRRLAVEDLGQGVAGVGGEDCRRKYKGGNQGQVVFH